MGNLNLSGKAFLDEVRRKQIECENSVRGHEELLVHLANVISVIDRFAGGFLGHYDDPYDFKYEYQLEYLVGRTCSSALSSLALMNFGFYDESLSLNRTIAETGNLIELFRVQPEDFQRWYIPSSRKIQREFSAGRVRKALSKKGLLELTDSKRYSKLCRFGIHPTSESKFQDHGFGPALGSLFQPKGYSLCVEELSRALLTVVIPVGAIHHVLFEHGLLILAERLLDSIGEFPELKTYLQDVLSWREAQEQDWGNYQELWPGPRDIY